MIGWIKLFRPIMAADWYRERPYDRAHAWVDLLLLASYKTAVIYRHGKAIELMPGDVAASIRQLAERWGWGKDRVYRYLNQLALMEMVSCQNSIITITNYKMYQDTNQDTNRDNLCDTQIIGNASSYNKTCDTDMDNGGYKTEDTEEKEKEKNQKKKNIYKTKKKEDINTCTAKSDAYFEDFWRTYDKKINKKKCTAIFAKLPETDQQKIVATVADFVAIHADWQYRPYPETYLRNERWNDELSQKGDLPL